MDECQQTVNGAMVAWKDAQIATLEARYEWRELLEAANELEWEDHREKSEDLIAAQAAVIAAYEKRCEKKV